jgi:CheY-like chemotaxis protein
MTRPRILITDDEANIRLMIRTALESEGYGIDEAANGQEALEMTQDHPYDLMLLDLNMPVLDGMGVLEQLQDTPPDQKPRVVVLTAYGSIPAAVKATRLGATEFIEKPIAPDEVRKAVAEALAAPVAWFPDDALAGGYAVVLDRVRKALRMADYADAEALLMKAADLGEQDAAYFNLLGVLYEAQRKWNLARKFYGKAIRADGRYEPAQQNMRRIFELYQFGRSKEPVSLGDEEEDSWFAKLLAERAH